MKKQVTIIEHEMTNLRNVIMAFKYIDADVIVTDSYKKICEAERLVLPGVGAFPSGMAELKKKGLVESIINFAKTDRPFLGICLGMQMMFEYSEEFKTTKGLALIPGKVVAVPKTTIDAVKHKIPHIGWNRLSIPSNNCVWNNTIFNSIKPLTSMYFVHSYTAIPTYEINRLADCYYNGRLISAAVKADNLYGCQFHPERSGKKGLNVIQSFLNL